VTVARFTTSTKHSNMLYVGWALPPHLSRQGVPSTKILAQVEGSAQVAVTYVSGSDVKGYYLMSKGVTFKTGLVSVELTYD